ncbi:L-ornithine transporter [Mycena polygramma]|nr:L-ornithine transporter [Mycena polygramma]
MSLRATVKEIVIGSFAGIVSEVIEYPADLAKVRLQAQLFTPPADERQRFKGPIDCLTKTWKNEGLRGLYRGLPAPVAGSMVETGALFLSYSYFQNLIRTYAPSSTTPSQLTIPQLGLAAAGAGFVTSFILTPIELVKCKMQVQLMNTTTSARVPPIHTVPKSVAALARSAPTGPTAASPIFHHILASTTERRPPGLIAIARSTVATHGVRGLWLGHTGTLLRETGGTASWFAVKEWVAAALLDRRLGPTRIAAAPHNNLLPWESAVAGAVSGAACVLALYPADTVKSAMQTEEELLSHRPRVAERKLVPASFYRTFTKMYTNHGIRGLYAGCGMTVLRAVPSSGIVFVVYDGLSAWIG